MEYYILFEKLTDLMTALDGFDIPEIYATLAEICKILNVSKGVTSFYENEEAEAEGKGEHFVCYDNGGEHVPSSSVRLVTPAGVVITSSVYQNKGAEPLTDEQKHRVDIIERMMVNYLNRSRQEKIIQHLMYYGEDGYPNLRYFYSEIMRLKNAGELVGKCAARMNLKHFTLVNDKIGMQAGNIVLRRYCRALEEAFNHQGIVCRLGGDNFVALFDSQYLPEVEKCLRGIPIVYDEIGRSRVEVSAITGLYKIENQDEVEDPGSVMGRIVDAYQIAKKDYTDDVIFYRDVFQVQKANDMHVHNNFIEGLRNEEFKVYYQPKVDIQTNQLIGAEALCRWIHDGVLIPPMDFIPALERGTDICELDFYMLDHVCRDIRRWLDNDMPVVRVSVNLSRRHMIDPDLYSHIVDIIDRYQIPHELIEIELTETTTDVEFRYLKRVVNQLQNVGIYVSVDDFGVGYSSLNLIKQIPWDVLKLDKSILPTHDEDADRSSRMFSYIVSMANEIGMKCVAEGVETEDQLDMMKESGCYIAQGFFFDKPLPVEEFEERMIEKTYAS